MSTKLPLNNFFLRSPKIPFRYFVEIKDTREESDKNTKINNLIDPWIIVNATLPKIDIKSEVFKASRPISYPFINFSNMEINLTMEENDQSVVAYFIEKCIMKRTDFIINELNTNDTSKYVTEFQINKNAVRRMTEDKTINTSGLTIIIHELNDTMSQNIITHIFSHCWLTSTSSYKWSYTSDSAVSYQLSFSFLTYEIDENEKINSDEYSTYLQKLNNKTNSINTAIINKSIQITNNNKEQEKTFINELKNKYQYLDITKKDNTIVDVQNNNQTKHTYSSGKAQVLRSGTMAPVPLKYNTSIKLVYDKSTHTISVINTENNQTTKSISNVYTSTRR